ncbi:DUF6086 family protein [Embleya sp. NBC_00896]|uniref:DUF6086 family protein n=1 Tax=Embleya sp. NBC_00896 TaxID=2975961 RepID=UPI0038701DFC|nr:DUF6086 family protein [Embleya sp. NBC_00896]
MSHLFEASGESIWFPALRVGRLYLAAVDGLSAVLGVESGLTTDRSDTSRIEPAAFERFTRAVFAAHFGTSHPELRLLTLGPLVVSLALLEKLGVTLQAADPEQAAVLAKAREHGIRFPT